MENLCPFLNEECTEACMFRCKKPVETSLVGFTPCLIAIKLHQINEYSHEDLVNLTAAIQDK